MGAADTTAIAIAALWLYTMVTNKHPADPRSIGMGGLAIAIIVLETLYIWRGNLTARRLLGWMFALFAIVSIIAAAFLLPGWLSHPNWDQIKFKAIFTIAYICIAYAQTRSPAKSNTQAP
ncbi:MAG: hypothetical protein GC162_13240 [Planctomycetes bacterium]|nr:hypothetical protein [Planctomycetota bacterium]